MCQEECRFLTEDKVPAEAADLGERCRHFARPRSQRSRVEDVAEPQRVDGDGRAFRLEEDAVGTGDAHEQAGIRVADAVLKGHTHSGAQASTRAAEQRHQDASSDSRQQQCAGLSLVNARMKR